MIYKIYFAPTCTKIQNNSLTFMNDLLKSVLVYVPRHMAFLSPSLSSITFCFLSLVCVQSKGSRAMPVCRMRLCEFSTHCRRWKRWQTRCPSFRASCRPARTCAPSGTRYFIGSLLSSQQQSAFVNKVLKHMFVCHRMLIKQ